MAVRLRKFQALVGLLLLSPLSQASDKLHIAVAANFRQPLEQLIDSYPGKESLAVTLSAGSSGTLYSQILFGAPFDLFFSADSKRPELLETKGLSLPNSRVTYALGQLVLWQPENNGTPVNPHSLGLSGQKLAIANPRTAPYGEAAVQALEQINLWPDINSRLVKGSSVTQAYQFVQSGNATWGLIALSQALADNQPESAYWPVPEKYHQPIAQQAVILKRSKQSDLARDFLAYTQSAEAQQIIQQAGYRVP